MSRESFTFPVSSVAGTTPGLILKLLRRFHVEKQYYLKFALSFIVASVLSLFSILEKMIWGRRIREYRFKEPPVFIIGFNRSGTTLLHNLLCCDPDAGYTTTLQTVFPHCFLTQRFWLAPLLNFLVPKKRPFDSVPMNMNFPQEEEFALANLQLHSVYNFFVFPGDYRRIIEEDYNPDRLPASQIARWKKEYRQMVVKSLLNTGGKRYISKNPQNIPKTKYLRELFPGCHFIFIYRDPYVVVESMYNFILAIFRGIQLQVVPDSFSRREAAWFYSVAMEHYFRLKESPDPAEILEIRLEEFQKNKIDGLRKIYRFCSMDGFEEARPAFEAWLSKHPEAPHDTNNIHPDTVRYVNQYASEFVTRFGYPMRSC